jgi:hypothetical protein
MTDLLRLPIQVGDKVSADAAEIGFLVRGVTRLSIEAKNPLRLFGYLSGAWGLKGVAEVHSGQSPETHVAICTRSEDRRFC